MAMPSAYKPSPLGYGTPRSSPFRRQESPASPTPVRQISPGASPTKTGASFAPPRLANSPAPADCSENRTLRGHAQPNTMTSPSSKLGSPVQMSPRPQTMRRQSAGTNALSQLQPAQMRVLRDAFQVLDRDSDGVVNREDVADMLGQLGLPTNPSDLSEFFPPDGPQTMTLAVFLNSIAASLAAMSPAAELLSALAAFDDDDSGQADLVELRDALVRTAPEPGERALTLAEVDKIVQGFSGRRAFTKHSVSAAGAAKRGEVFRYREFVNSIVGGGGAAEPNSNEAAGE
ncbi:hypothetical protein DL764_003868 [Monosporascus ibericus]|uniref:EF-hand domain-containing protein n=1 Tax=Monosporascus ibericus TaxID=155417 RepID=A0A4Q4TEY6_9PEZI|nr:hypothetical protein DL764_003868 [Monosporascus ibericus]